MLRHRKRSYWLNLILSIAGYDCDISPSAALGEIQWVCYNGRNIPFEEKPFAHWLQTHLDRVEKCHCLIAYKNELLVRQMIIPEDLRLRCWEAEYGHIERTTKR